MDLKQNETGEEKPQTINNSEIERISTDVEREGNLTPDTETKSQFYRGHTEGQGPNKLNTDTTIDDPTHFKGKEYNTSNRPNEIHKSKTSTCTSQLKTDNETQTASFFPGNTVEQGQPDSKPDQKLQQKSEGDTKSDNMKTSRFSNVIGSWKDELIVGCLVMTIVTLAFLLFVCFYYEKKIDNMNEEFKTELTKLRAEIKNQNKAVGRDTCSQNDDIQKNLNTKIDTIISNITKMNDTINILSEKISTEKQNRKDELIVLTEKIPLVWENDTRLSNAFTSLNNSFDFFKTDTTQKYNSLKSSVDIFIETVERNIWEKVTPLDQQIEILQTAKKKLETDVDKIFPNTFNKGALTAAFGIVIVLVLGLYGYVFLYLRNATGVGRTGSTLMHNNSVAVLKQIPNNPALKNSVCIVSFDEQRCPIHRTLVTPACQGKDIKTFVVRQHTSLLDMPRCRLYIMCAEFSERHVIIEQPNLGLGDLKRCTHDAVRKIGGELVILYTRDPGSRRLADGQMFNRDIYCVNDQPELCALRDKGRFISLYDSLTPSQTRKLTETVEECLQ